jgi:hypothetical protein
LKLCLIPRHESWASIKQTKGYPTKRAAVEIVTCDRPLMAFPVLIGVCGLVSITLGDANPCSET